MDRVTRRPISILSSPIWILTYSGHLPYRYCHLKVISISIPSSCHLVHRMTISYHVTLPLDSARHVVQHILYPRLLSSISAYDEASTIHQPLRLAPGGAGLPIVNGSRGSLTADGISQNLKAQDPDDLDANGGGGGDLSNRGGAGAGGRGFHPSASHLNLSCPCR